MPYARIFQSGNSQAVRLPKEFRFNTDRVEIFRRGDEIVLRETPANGTAIFDTLASLSDDFMADGREDAAPPPPPRTRGVLMGVRYMLDTNICIYIAKHNPPAVRERFSQHASQELAMSVITLGELRFGAEKSQVRDRVLTTINQLAGLIPLYALPEAAAKHYGQIRADLQKNGQSLGNNDLWLAAHARAEGWILVANNEREFNRVSGLQVENWVSMPTAS